MERGTYWRNNGQTTKRNKLASTSKRTVVGSPSAVPVPLHLHTQPPTKNIDQPYCSRCYLQPAQDGMHAKNQRPAASNSQQQERSSPAPENSDDDTDNSEDERSNNEFSSSSSEEQTRSSNDEQSSDGGMDEEDRAFLRRNAGVPSNSHRCHTQTHRSPSPRPRSRT